MEQHRFNKNRHRLNTRERGQHASVEVLSSHVPDVACGLVTALLLIPRLMLLIPYCCIENPAPVAPTPRSRQATPWD